MHRLAAGLCVMVMTGALAGCGVAEADRAGPRLPAIVAHRAGTADYPENTLRAIDGALHNGADRIWLTVQISADGVPVLYRPNDLSALTPERGPVSSRTAAELTQINAGWNFSTRLPNGEVVYPYRANPTPIPTLDAALAAIPADVPVILDMKALPAEPQARAVANVLTARGAWSRVLIYSTDASYQKAFAGYRLARMFESRDATRGRLLDVALSGRCDAPDNGVWTAFEWQRDMQVIETFTLGEGRSPVRAKLWTRAALACLDTNGPAHTIAIGINSLDAYREAGCLGIEAVLVDSPKNAREWRAQTAQRFDCSAMR
ncbi:glycerophosphodiester phosphodiesterase family protein [Pararobbsia silviterrae]